MRVQLISGIPNEKRTGGEIDSIYPPLGLLYLASYSRKHIQNLDFKITDGNLIGYEKTLKEIERFQPDVVGFSVGSFGVVGAYKLINYIKNKYPDIFVIAGGPHTTALPDEITKNTLVDVNIVGEGEKTFKELIEYKTGKAKKMKNIKGIFFKKNKKLIFTGQRKPIEDLNEIPFPARDLINIKKYPGFVVVKRLPETDIVSSRGCPYNCVFCSNPVWKSSKPFVRLRDPTNVADEVEELIHNHGIKEFYDQCDEFNLSLPWSEKVCDEFISRDFDIPWKVQMRADRVTDSLAAKLEKSGCWLVSLGIESGNQETLNGVKKSININKVVKSCKILKNRGIKVFGLFMAFNVWEENGRLRYEGVEKTRNTLRFAKKLIDRNLLDYMSWTLTAPFPGSKLYELAIRHKLIPREVLDGKEEWNNTWRLLLNLPNVSKKDWEMVKNEGAKLQARCLLKNGNMNRSLIPLYLRRGVNISKLQLKNTLGRISA